MRFIERIHDLPVEDWAAMAARASRRVRRRVVRRPVGVAAAAAGGFLALAVAGNALWGQSGPHPAPLWGGSGEREMAVAAHGAPAATREVPGAAERSSLVAKVQAGLAEQGYLDGPASGILDETTRAAIERFEEAQGLPVTGEPSVGLLAAVSSGIRAVPAPSDGPSPVRLSVADMQRLLNERGFGPLEVDGLMGPQTRAALSRFAEANGFDPADPEGPAVMRALAAGGA